MRSKEFLKKIVEALGITINMYPKGKPRKRENLKILRG